MRSSDSRSGSSEDIRATFVCMTNNANGVLKSPEDLTRALQRCGRNPTKKRIEIYWRKYDRIGIEEFSKIASREEKISERELIEAFRAIDVNRDGYITFKELSNLFTTMGDPMSSHEIKHIFEEADLNNDGKLNYREFTKLFIDTIERLKAIESKRVQKLVTERDFELRHFTNDRHSARKSARSHEDLTPRADVKSMMKNELRLNRDNSIESMSRRKGQKSHRSGSDSEREKSRHDLYESSFRSRASERTRHSARYDEPELDLKKINKKKGKFMLICEKNHRAIATLKEESKEPRNLRRWCTKTIKGGFYYNEANNGIISNTYALDIRRETDIYLTIETYQTDLHTNSDLVDMDVSVLIVKNSSNLVLKGLTEDKFKNKWCTRVTLKPGRYFIFPFTSGCHLKKRAIDTARGSPKFFKTDPNNKRTLSRQFKDALGVIFDLCDLDANGRLNQEELNLYTFLTANESLSTDEWNFVGETIGFERNELTKEGFIQLSKIEAGRDDTDIDDITMRINNMGFNKSLTIDQSCPYVINVSSENDEIDLLIGEIYKLKAAEKFICQLIEQKGVPIEFKNFSVYEYSNDYLAYIAIKNQSSGEVSVDLDCSKVENTLANCPSLINSFNVKADKSKLAMVLTSKDPRRDWLIKCGLNMNEGDRSVGRSRYD